MFTVADIRIHDRPPIVFYIFERQGFRPASILCDFIKILHVLYGHDEQ